MTADCDLALVARARASPSHVMLWYKICAAPQALTGETNACYFNACILKRRRTKKKSK